MHFNSERKFNLPKSAHTHLNHFSPVNHLQPPGRFILLRLLWLETRPAQYYSIIISNMKNDEHKYTGWMDRLKYIVTLKYAVGLIFPFGLFLSCGRKPNLFPPG